MGRESNPGLKILWLWTIGTAAVLVTNVVTTRFRDMEKVMNHEEPASNSPASALLQNQLHSHGIIPDENS